MEKYTQLAPGTRVCLQPTEELMVLTDGNAEFVNALKQFFGFHVYEIQSAREEQVMVKPYLRGNQAASGNRWPFWYFRVSSKDTCILCGCESRYDAKTPVHMRKGYIPGGGQICDICQIELKEAEIPSYRNFS